MMYVTAEATDRGDVYTPRLSHPPTRLFLDVDNCLYRDTELCKGIETQIVRGIKKFCQHSIGLTGAEADRLFHTYGSTEEGLRRTLWKNETRDTLSANLQNYYDSVYSGIDVSALLPQSQKTQSTFSTGYSHAMAQRRQVRQMLRATPSLLTLASNSPSFHVRKVLQALGLCHVATMDDLLSPDHVGASVSSLLVRDAVLPTKVSPVAFFGKLLEASTESMALVDDSAINLKAAAKFIKGYRVSDNQSLLEALAKAWGWLDEAYEFSQVDYLTAKNQVDKVSINRNVWNALLTNLAEKLSTRTETRPLTIVDVGAGLLNMHHLLLCSEEDTSGLQSLRSFLTTNGLDAKVNQINYVAYEPNENLRASCVDKLVNQGYSLAEEFAWDSDDSNGHVKEIVFVKTTSNHQTIQLSIRFWDFRRDIKTQGSDLLLPDLIVGCCFADLLSPDELVGSLLRCFLNRPTSTQPSALIYFPITFWGVTQFVPSSLMEIGSNSDVPSDTQAFTVYSRVLEDVFGHSLNPHDLIESVKDHGGTLLARGSSDWKIDPVENEYLWRTMMYFFAVSAGPELQSQGYDVARWIRRAWEKRPMIQASNMDILLELSYMGRKGDRVDKSVVVNTEGRNEYVEIEFSAPHEVTFVSKKREKLKPNEIRVRARCSLISSGTELKIYTGSFDDATLDVNIESMEGQRMQYPLAYGYSLVGEVTECGENVDEAKYRGKLVFTFSAHSSEVVTPADAVHLVPEGINPFDAIFMPSIETAVSIIHDANPRLGENICVFGQGLIGLLVTAMLSLVSPNLRRPCLTTVDTFPERLALSSLLGAQQTVLPAQVSSSQKFDVAIEVSGNFRALQSAIDHTRNGGRIIIASWYGKAPVNLHLGIDFHRSHKTIKTSQVSELPAELRQTWTKERRFDLAWGLLKDLQPSRLLTKVALPKDAKQIYEELNKGSQVAVAFDYAECHGF